MEITRITLPVRFQDGLIVEKTFGLLPPYDYDREVIVDPSIFYWVTVKEYLSLCNKNSTFRISDTWEIVK